MYAKKDSDPEKQVILLNISNGEGWYVAVKKLSALFKGITSKHYGDFYCLNCLHSFRTENKLNHIKRVCENKDFCNVVLSSENTKKLFNQYQKSDKELSAINAELQGLIEKMYGCKSNPANSTTTNVREHVPSSFSMATISPFKSIKNKHDVYRGKDCMKKFCESLREHAMKIILKREKRSY